MSVSQNPRQLISAVTFALCSFFVLNTFGLNSKPTVQITKHSSRVADNSDLSYRMGEEEASNTKIKRIPIEDVQRFTRAISQIKNFYVKPVKDEELFDDAIQGMLEGLDPHSAYLDEDAFKELKLSTKGEFSGIGIEVTMENGVIKVISPIDGTPAKKAGLKSGDYIIKLDGKPIKGLKLRDAVKKMRGKRGTPINLTIIRKGVAKPFDMKIVRDTVKIQSVKSELIEKKYGYIRISHFQAPTAKLLKSSLRKLIKQAGGRLEGLILDLRDNPGGLLDAAIDIADAFIHNDQKGKEELIVYTKGRIPGSKFTAVATPGDLLQSKPIVVLINQGSASGSEIVAGALKDHNRAILVGKKSFGKGSVQTILPLDNSRGIKLTTALYYTPAGTSIQAKGLEPDIQIEEMDMSALKKVDKSGVNEADLSGHIENGNGKAKAKKEKSGKLNASKMIKSDYQLRQALNILKALAVLKPKSESKRQIKAAKR